ncbi:MULTISPECIES: SPOR domain-containing protein [unclassified Lysobacter]|uniref:SPOR domain-containing protein n=1 Tax=unclassified Lysobacter TaxID=2635362 RepID=UPI001C24F8B7|nr:SPOR domain-containing protein [Lysobacter sp. MMG2]MBU8975280.1 SPOR domain-containing protein [Lysobacter sp. MMG2]
MEPALKQRVIGAVVLIALAVIFLPMLIKGPAPESGASNVPLELPKAPQGDFETRELPLVSPGQAPEGGALGMNADANANDTLPTVDTTVAPQAAPVEGALPAATAGGNFAVSFGSYASAGDADRVIKALQGAQLAAYQEPVPSNGRTLHRVRIGPFATQAEAEAARLQSGRVRGDVGAKVVVLDAETAAPVAAVSQPAPAQAAAVSAPVPLAESQPAPVASKPLPAETKPAAPKPAPAPEKPVAKVEKPATPVSQPAARPSTPAAAGVGFAVQLGAFGSASEADKLRDRARGAGFSAFVEQVRTDKGVLNRVRVGPVSSRADADQLKAQVASRLGVSGIVRPHP